MICPGSYVAGMKALFAVGICLCMASASAVEPGAGNLYKFQADQTNVYKVEVEAQSDVGPETAVGMFTFSTAAVKDSNNLKITIRGQFANRPGRSMMYRPGNVPLLGMLGAGPMMPPQGRELIVNSSGVVLRSGVEQALPVPFGTLFNALFPSAAEVDQTNDVVYVMDEPFIVGPCQFFTLSQYGGYMYGGYNPGQSPPGILKARRSQKTAVQKTNDGTEVRQTVAIDTLLNTGDEPRISSSGQATWLIDSQARWPKTAQWEAKTLMVSENLTRRLTLKLTAKRLEGEELQNALNPPPPPPPEPVKEQVLSAQAASELIEKLNSDDASARMNAASDLSNKRVEPLPDAALNALIPLVTHSDDFIRRAAIKILVAQARADDLPVLLRAYNNMEDAQVRQQIIKAIGRMKTEKAANALAELIAAGPVDNFGGNRTSDPSEALSAMGPVAENAVLPLLEERNLRTLVEACAVLKAVGTQKSMEALKNLASHPNKTVSEAAAAALRDIKARQ